MTPAEREELVTRLRGVRAQVGGTPQGRLAASAADLIESQAKRIEGLEKALRFYAGKKHVVSMYDTPDWGEPDGDFNLYDVNYIEAGGIARDALGEMK